MTGAGTGRKSTFAIHQGNSVNCYRNQSLAVLSKPYSPAKITEPEMPIEMHDTGAETQSVPKDRIRQKPDERGLSIKAGIKLPSDVITPPQFAGLLAVEANPKAERIYWSAT